MADLKHRDFTGLAARDSKFRPRDSESVRSAALALVGKLIGEIDFADVGPSTGTGLRRIEVGYRTVAWSTRRA